MEKPFVAQNGILSVAAVEPVLIAPRGLDELITAVKALDMEDVRAKMAAAPAS